MKYSLLALTALLLPPQAMMVQAGDTMAAVADTTKAKLRAMKGDSVDVLVGEYDLTSSGEFVRIELEKGQVYRVEYSGRSGTLQIRPRLNSVQAALPMTIEDIPRASGTRALEIAPRQDGEYDFRASGTSGFGMRVRVFREVKPSQRWQRIGGMQS